MIVITDVKILEVEDNGSRVWEYWAGDPGYKRTAVQRTAMVEHTLEVIQVLGTKFVNRHGQTVVIANKPDVNKYLGLEAEAFTAMQRELEELRQDRDRAKHEVSELEFEASKLRSTTESLKRTVSNLENVSVCLWLIVVAFSLLSII